MIGFEISFLSIFIKKKGRAGEAVQWLPIQTNTLEDQRLVLSTRVGLLMDHVISAPGDLNSFLASLGTCICTHMHTQVHTHIETCTCVFAQSHMHIYLKIKRSYKKKRHDLGFLLKVKIKRI